MPRPRRTCILKAGEMYAKQTTTWGPRVPLRTMQIHVIPGVEAHPPHAPLQIPHYQELRLFAKTMKWYSRAEYAECEAVYSLPRGELWEAALTYPQWKLIRAEKLHGPSKHTLRDSRKDDRDGHLPMCSSASSHEPFWEQNWAPPAAGDSPKFGQPSLATSTPSKDSSHP